MSPTPTPCCPTSTSTRTSSHWSAARGGFPRRGPCARRTRCCVATTRPGRSGRTPTPWMPIRPTGTTSSAPGWARRCRASRSSPRERPVPVLPFLFGLEGTAAVIVATVLVGLALLLWRDRRRALRGLAAAPPAPARDWCRSCGDHVRARAGVRRDHRLRRARRPLRTSEPVLFPGRHNSSTAPKCGMRGAAAAVRRRRRAVPAAASPPSASTRPPPRRQGGRPGRGRTS